MNQQEVEAEHPVTKHKRDKQDVTRGREETLQMINRSFMEPGQEGCPSGSRGRSTTVARVIRTTSTHMLEDVAPAAARSSDINLR